ncbi:ATP-sensitive inward rectifier potassium channel 1a.1 [Electrophorus electricus]|uniref:Potassium inwardly rectifying channel subfamily J member 1a, tandem duplicate 6 n=1 Tax=Electrophorus electricus TaxID=8005 RepID=A0A4W4HD23_ELEEL|nr:ATP-sensitive inward rectifier potassium channel 1a.1 [Electrophorus electricus]
MTRSLCQLFRNYLAKRQIKKNRIVTKDGHCNIEFGNVRHSSRLAFVLDLWTTLVEIRWRFVLLFFVASFTLSWFIFGLIWYWIARDNGDMWWQVQPPNHKPCIYNVFGLTSAFLYSLETQMTIGYGLRVLSPFCPGAVALIIIQSVIGLIINCFWCGLFMAKLTLPKRRAKTITFSKIAVICPKNGNLCLQIRVANLRKTLMIGSQLYGKLLRTTVTPEGETVILDQVNVDFMVDAGKDNLFFICPLTLYHVIDKTSPFFKLAVDTLQQQDFELVVFLDGTDESTSSACQVRTSYIPLEIKWGYKFLPIISRTKEGKYRVDFSNFGRVESVPAAHCALCFYNGQSNHHHPKDGFDNQGFEMMDVNNQASATVM